MRILDAKSEAGFAPDDVHVKSADGEMRGNFVVVCLGAKRLRLRRRTRYEKVSRKFPGRRIQSDGFALEMQDRKMGGVAGAEMDFVVRRGADGVVAGLEPFKADEREPAVWLQKVCDVLRAPRGEVFLPGSLLR